MIIVCFLYEIKSFSIVQDILQAVYFSNNLQFSCTVHFPFPQIFKNKKLAAVARPELTNCYVRAAQAQSRAKSVSGDPWYLRSVVANVTCTVYHVQLYML